jgi:DNA-directed RNA polymerase specialized sigma24 family protein
LKVQDFSDKSPVTELLREWSRGDRAALDQLIPLIHTDLHAIARRRLHSMAPGSSMQATALVNEVYLRLVDSGSVMSTFATAPISLRSAPP